MRTLLGQLDTGEAEVVALAIEMGGQIPVLVDDRRGRRLATERGLQVFGSGGVLVLAKDRGMIAQVRPLLDDLRLAGLYLSNAARDRLLAAAGE